MKKKLWFAIGAVILVVAAFFIFQTDFFSGEKGEKEVFVTVKDEVKNVVLLERARFHTDAETLGDFLEEKKETLGVVMVDSEYGRFVTTIWYLLALSQPFLEQNHLNAKPYPSTILFQHAKRFPSPKSTPNKRPIHQ